MSQATGGPVSVLIVDDNDFFRRDVESWIRAEPRFNCIGSFADGNMGLEEILAKSPNLAIVDLPLPGLHGIEVIRSAHDRLPMVKLLVVTEMPDDHLVFEALEAGAEGFLDKPLGHASFFASLDEVLRDEYPLSSRARKLVAQKYRSMRPDSAAMSSLSHREREIAELAFIGLSDEAIAKRLSIALHTVRWHQKKHPLQASGPFPRRAPDETVWT